MREIAILIKELIDKIKRIFFHIFSLMTYLIKRCEKEEGKNVG